MRSIFSKILKLIALGVLLLISGLVLWGLWQASTFFEAELIHNELMAVGEGRDLTMFERVKIKVVWIPFGIVLIGVLIVHASLMCSLLKKR